LSHAIGNRVRQVEFTCNICGTLVAADVSLFHREISNCPICNSTPRFRGIIGGLSKALFGKFLCLQDFPEDKKLRGLGMSEWPGYAETLAKKFDFIDTKFHTEPYLDVLNDEHVALYKDLDFVISTDVFEHILQPVARGFANVRKMLKPAGAFIFSVPFTDQEKTKEHFPSLFNFEVLQKNGQWIVLNQKSDGEYEVFDKNLYFHGGPGTVLEMRLFGRDDLFDLIKQSGFLIEVMEPNNPLQFGYYWPKVEERPGTGLNLSYIILARANEPKY